VFREARMSKELAAVELARELAVLEGMRTADGVWNTDDPRLLFEYYQRALTKVHAFDPAPGA